MKFNLPYYGRKINELQEKLDKAESEIQKLKENEKTVHIDEEQLNCFLVNLTERMDLNSTEVVYEIKSNTVEKQKSNRDDLFSSAIRVSLALLFILFGIVLAVNLYKEWSTYWNMGMSYRISLFFMCFIVFDCEALGIDIFVEKDRNYIVALFSALVALVALIVTLVK